MKILVLVLSAVLGFGCNGLKVSSDDTSQPPAPPENYIPIVDKDNVCDLYGGEGAYTQAKETITTFLASHTTYRAPTIELCDELLSNGCAPCDIADNDVARLMRDIDSANSLMGVPDEGEAGANPYGTLRNYFYEALKYPYRFLGVHVPTGEGKLLFTQLIEQPCASEVAGCTEYDVSPDSLTKSCDAVNLTFTFASQADGDFTTEENTAGVFGFYVPLIEELPDSSLSDAEFIEAIHANEHVAVYGRKPSMTYDADTGCGIITAWVDKRDVDPVVPPTFDLTPYHNDAWQMKVLLSVKLEPTTAIGPPRRNRFRRDER